MLLLFPDLGVSDMGGSGVLLLHSCTGCAFVYVHYMFIRTLKRFLPQLTSLQYSKGREEIKIKYNKQQVLMFISCFFHGKAF